VFSFSLSLFWYSIPFASVLSIIIIIIIWATFYNWKRIGEKAVQNELIATGLRPLFVVSLFKIVSGVSSTWCVCSFCMTLFTGLIQNLARFSVEEFFNVKCFKSLAGKPKKVNNQYVL